MNLWRITFQWAPRFAVFRFWVNSTKWFKNPCRGNVYTWSIPCLWRITIRSSHNAYQQEDDTFFQGFFISFTDSIWCPNLGSNIHTLHLRHRSAARGISILNRSYNGEFPIQSSLWAQLNIRWLTLTTDTWSYIYRQEVRDYEHKSRYFGTYCETHDLHRNPRDSIHNITTNQGEMFGKDISGSQVALKGIA